MRLPPLLLCASAAAAADPITLVMPTTLHQPVGATAALRGGAVYALGDEAAATWYNPALAAGLAPDQISAGATAYGANRIDVSAGDETQTLLSGAVLKVYGSLSGRSADGDWGWTGMFCNPMHWTGAVDRGRAEPTPTARSYATQVRVYQDTWSAQIAVGRRVESLACGLALVGNYDSVDLRQSAWTRDMNGRYGSVDFIASAWSTSLQGRGGLTWSPDERLSLALGVTTPAWELMHGGVVSESGAASDPVAGSAASSDARVDGDAFRFVHPWQIGLGGGWREPAWEAELDLVWTLPEATSETVPALPGYRSQTSGGTTTITSLLAPARTTSYRHVVNARLGGSVLLAEPLRLHAGAFTDFSPVETSDIYNRIDLYGVSAGIELRRGQTGLVLGGSATWGSDVLTVNDLSTGTTREGRIGVLTVDFLIGTVSKF